jgi:hypothetical protein
VANIANYHGNEDELLKVEYDPHHFFKRPVIGIWELMIVFMPPYLDGVII